MYKVTATFEIDSSSTDAAQRDAEALRTQAYSVGLRNWTVTSVEQPAPSATFTAADLVALGVAQDAAERAVSGS